MKHALLALCALALVAMLFVPTSASAQNAYNVNDKTISAGIGLGNVVGFYGSTTFPPIFLAFETGLPIEELKNKLTIGGTIGYAGSSEEWSWGKWSYSYIFIGANGNYHFLEKNPKIDAFAGLGLGYTIASSSYTAQPGLRGLQLQLQRRFRLLRLRHTRGSPVLLHPEICRSCGAWVGIRHLPLRDFLQDLGLAPGTGRRSGGIVTRGDARHLPFFTPERPR